MAQNDREVVFMERAQGQPRPDARSTSSVTGSTVEVGLCFQINNLYNISESESKFSAELILNITWVDPLLSQSLQDGSLQAQLEPAGCWEDFQPGWMFKDFVSAPLSDQKNFRSARILNELVDNKPHPTWMNELENHTATEDPIYLVDAQIGRVAYALTVKSTFDEVMELEAFPFDHQYFDIRCYWEDTDKYSWRLAKHPFEKCGFYGAWKMNKAKTKIVEHPEWTLDVNLHDHINTFKSAGSDTVFPRYTMRIAAQRNYTYFVINVFGVVFLQVGLGVGIYLFEALEFAERFSNILTLFLTIVAFRIVLTDKLPKVAYLTIADQYMLSAFVQYTFTAAACFSMVALYKDEQDEARAEEVDDICMYTYLGFWLFAHVYTVLATLRARATGTRERHENTGWYVANSGKKMVLDADGKVWSVEPY